jgi:DNA replication protein DnaC
MHTHGRTNGFDEYQGYVQSMGEDIQSFPLPAIDEQNEMTDNIPREITEETNIEVDAEDAALPKRLNDEQRMAYDEILSTVDHGGGGLFFVDGPGGTGKTFLYRALLATVRGQGKIALATATSSAAASIKPGGRTAYSRFKIPLRIHDGAIRSFTKQSGTAKLLQAASLIIWDEAIYD